MRKVLLLLTLLPGLSLADGYLINQDYCTARALVGKASAEARDRHTPLEEWRRELLFMRVYGEKQSLLTVGASVGIHDLENVYGVSKDLHPNKVYVAFFNSCMSLQGRTVSAL